MMTSWKNVGRRPFEANPSRELTEVLLMPSTPKITHAAPHDNPTLTLTFSNGEQRLFDAYDMLYAESTPLPAEVE